MNLNVHFHVAVPDGVFTSGKRAAHADFWRLPTPDRMDVETLTVSRLTPTDNATTTGAVDIAVVTARTDRDFDAAPSARKEPKSRFLA